ncbi:hypothetical protein VCHA43P277_90115 [Vibrio chagasii]|nr:hypothetical protein VCHA37P199_100080 [Vibrio chagasii]CAH7060648.1 hypothetical protein VCHA36P161_70114 [Vibrio chagasii]CAH7067750.1 hypothetical protein VCHA40O235_10510 [Vibrio chagasii]CAH7070548.1 hypothetical protein VCHA40P238_10372 [Vibrio chagasii]CAH7087309.1 hypothetical protein VCHA34P126_80128 [Vibrio chagasii]
MFMALKDKKALMILTSGLFNFGEYKRKPKRFASETNSVFSTLLELVSDALCDIER